MKILNMSKVRRTGKRYAEFMSRIAGCHEQKGYRVSVALAPKTSSDQKGLLYEGIDYAPLGEQADRLRF